MTTTSMKERLARALWAQWHSGSEIDDSIREEVWRQDKDDFLPMVDAFLREMLEPSEAALNSLFGPAVGPESMREFFKADLLTYLQHILNKSQD